MNLIGRTQKKYTREQKLWRFKADHLKLENYTGTYRDPWFGEVKVALKEGKLRFTSIDFSFDFQDLDLEKVK